MSCVKLQPGGNPGTADALCALLNRLGIDFKNLMLRVDMAQAEARRADTGYRPRQMKALGKILKRARKEIECQITALGGANPTCAESVPIPSGLREEFDLEGFMSEFRGCCRRLCTALNEARRVSDHATSALLCNLALRLERQLWLLDTRPDNHEIEYGRVVSLFLAC
jgi:hypothetical protein